MERSKIQPRDVAPLLDKIRYKERRCNDGQCCSYDLDDPDLPDRVFDKYYWILEYESRLRFYTHDILRAACPDLEVDFSEDKGILYMGTFCKIYFNRPQECRDFGTTIKCNFRKYVENTKERHYYKSLFLLVLEKDKFLEKYPFLDQFNLAGKHPRLDYSIRGIYLSSGLYIPMPADEKMLPN
ncbi:MAG: hypothetical protein JRI52_04890 [Deltaproteobacteria bacterium]|nr:hypothetical protein [Deltaproteobacteria bacterium]